MKKHFWLIAASVACLFVSGCSDSEGPYVLTPNFQTFDITFRVDLVEDEQNFLGGRIAVGTIGIGRYIFDLNTVDTTPEMDSFGYYPHTAPPSGIVLEAGAFTFQSDPDYLDFWISMENDVFFNDVQMDVYAVTSFNNYSTTPDLAVTEINWVLSSRFLGALESSELVPFPPNLTEWNESNLLVVQGHDINSEEGYFYFECTVTDVVSVEEIR